MEMIEKEYVKNMAKYFYEKMQQAGYRVKRVTVYETPNNAACYEE